MLSRGVWKSVKICKITLIYVKLPLFTLQKIYFLEFVPFKVKYEKLKIKIFNICIFLKLP